MDDNIEKCQSCKTNDGEEEHQCPYKSDICNDMDYKCNCCNPCKTQCAMDI
jgi:flavoprotein